MAENLIAFPDELIGKGFYKLGYVTNDRDRAVEHLKTKLGFEEFAPFEPAFIARTPDGREQFTKMRCAFSKGRSMVVEVLQPVEGLVDVWAEPLKDAKDFTIVFHHIGLVTDNIEQVKATAAKYGIEPALVGTVESGAFEFTYMHLPGLGHLVEHIQYFNENAAAFLNSVRAPLK